MQVALGKEEEDSYKPNTYLLSEHLKGNCGLLCSQDPPDTIIDYFENYSCPYFGSAGSIPYQTIVLKRGGDDLKDFPSSMESQFRQLGVTVKVNNSQLVLLNDYVLCESGKPLDGNQAQMAKHLGINLDEFKIDILAYLITKTGEYKDLSSKYGIEKQDEPINNDEMDDEI